MTRFVLLTTQRSGSTYIRLWLNGHPSVRCHAEVFLDTYPAADGFVRYCQSTMVRRILHRIFTKPVLARNPYNPVADSLVVGYLDRLFNDPFFSAPWTSVSTWREYQPREASDGAKGVGFQLMYTQLRHYRELRTWLERQRPSIIHLIRQNALKLLLSRWMAAKTGVYHSFDQGFSELTARRIVVDTGKIRRRLAAIVEEREAMTALFAGHRYLEVTYEDFASRYSETARRILAFLNVEELDVRFPDMQKVIPDPVEQLVENLDELSSVLKGTPYEVFLQ